MSVVPTVFPVFSNAYQNHPCTSCDDPVTAVFLGILGLIVLGLFASMFWMSR